VVPSTDSVDVELSLFDGMAEIGNGVSDDDGLVAHQDLLVDKADDPRMLLDVEGSQQRSVADP
jgi:hypothetical protein